ncbi:hypothetical protein JCM3770_005608 [Rhodotorula araucariae]
MLDAALHGRLSPTGTGTGAALLVVSDSLLQPALAVVRAAVAAALASSARVVLVAAETPPRRLLPTPAGSAYDARHVRIVDGSLASPYASSSAAAAPACAAWVQVDLATPTGGADLVAAASEAIAHSADAAEPLLVVVDSANAIADELERGAAGAVTVVKGVLEALKGRPGARLLVTHHADLPPPPSSAVLVQPALLPALLSPSLSPSTLHLHLRPAAHLALLTRDYALAEPEPGSESAEALARAPGLLARLAERAVGDPFTRPLGSEDPDERAELGAEACVVEWTARGVDRVVPLSTAGARAGAGVGAGQVARDRDRDRDRDRAARGEVRRGVKWGLCGARTGADGALREVGAWEVVEVDPAALRTGTASPTDVKDILGEAHPPRPPAAAGATPTPSPAASAAAAAALPFSLHPATAAQAQARASVPNPFARYDLPIYGEEGYVAPVLPGHGHGHSHGHGVGKGRGDGTGNGAGGGGIEYTPDRGDDWDDEDPDGDLEL